MAAERGIRVYTVGVTDTDRTRDPDATQHAQAGRVFDLAHARITGLEIEPGIQRDVDLLGRCLSLGRGGFRLREARRGLQCALRGSSRTSARSASSVFVTLRGPEDAQPSMDRTAGRAGHPWAWHRIGPAQGGGERWPSHHRPRNRHGPRTGRVVFVPGRQDREGSLTRAERREAKALVELVDMLSLMKLRAERASRLAALSFLAASASRFRASRSSLSMRSCSADVSVSFEGAAEGSTVEPPHAPNVTATMAARGIRVQRIRVLSDQLSIVRVARHVRTRDQCLLRYRNSSPSTNHHISDSRRTQLTRT